MERFVVKSRNTYCWRRERNREVYGVSVLPNLLTKPLSIPLLPLWISL
jgi:hypothetical protein